jgi:murein DD-endopeptidase MepM/ murein hydrolase activator NlpD
MIIIVHPDDYITVYKHCSLLIKKERERVLQGELIALSGNTGEITTGPHLHFEVWKNGKPIDPKEILINY